MTFSSFHFLLFLSCIKAARSQWFPDGCRPSSCGGLRFSYPFRLTTDPDDCGKMDYQLSCINNTTIMEFHSGEYFVAVIDYGKSTIRIADIGLQRSNCSLPLKSLPPESISPYEFYNLVSRNWDGFLNCSGRIEGKGYRLLPCLSSPEKATVTFVYAVSGYRSSDLAYSCELISVIPVEDDLGSSEEDLFRALRRGFVLSFAHHRLTTSTVVDYCWDEAQREIDSGDNFFSQIAAIFKYENHMLHCLIKYTDLGRHYKITFLLSAVFIVLLMILEILIVVEAVRKLVFAPLVIIPLLVCGSRKNRSDKDDEKSSPPA